MSHSFADLANNLGQQLNNRGWKLVTAESCTGGGLGYWITSIPGSSTWYDRGFITYSDQSKIETLAIDPQIIKKWGAVSEQVAVSMAEAALSHSSAQVSIAITGIAGPSGGLPEKPVGTVWISSAGVSVAPFAKSYLFKGNRDQIRNQGIAAAFNLLLDNL